MGQLDFNPLIVIAAGAFAFSLLAFLVAHRSARRGRIIPVWRSQALYSAGIGKEPDLVDVVVKLTPQGTGRASSAWVNCLPLAASVVHRSPHDEHENPKLRSPSPRESSEDDENDLEVTMIILMPSPVKPPVSDDGSLLHERASATSPEPEEPPYFSLGTAHLPWHHPL